MLVQADVRIELQQTRTRGRTVSKRRASRAEHLAALKARRQAQKNGTMDVDKPDSDPSEDDMADPFAANEYDDDFLVDDNNEQDRFTDPELMRDMLPILSITSPEEAFAIVVDWLVKKRLAPGFEDQAEIYLRALRKLDDQASTYGSSKFSSSTWRPNFSLSLSARPYFRDQCTGFPVSDACQACGRSSHPGN